MRHGTEGAKRSVVSKKISHRNKTAVPASNSKSTQKQKGRHARFHKASTEGPREGPGPTGGPRLLQRLSRNRQPSGEEKHPHQGGSGPRRAYSLRTLRPQAPSWSQASGTAARAPGIITARKHCQARSDSKSSASRSSALAHQSPPGPVPTGGNPLCTRLRRTADVTCS